MLVHFLNKRGKPNGCQRCGAENIIEGILKILTAASIAIIITKE